MAEARRVLLVGVFPSRYGGTRAVCEDLAERLSSRGWQVVTTAGSSNRVLRVVQMLSRVARQRRAYSVAHVDVFSGSAFWWGLAAGALLHAARKPFGLTLHGGGLPEFARRFPGAVRHLLSRATFVTAPSAFLQRAFRSVRPDIRLVPNALHTQAYPFRQRSVVRPTLVWMRAFHSIYGPSMVPELVAGLARLEPRVTAAMYGPDKGDGSLEITRRRVEALGIAERIEFGGVVEKAKVPSILARADIFLNTSLVDNAPVILSEAMACGLCVVTSGAGGIPDIVTDGETGLVVSNGASAFQGAVARLLRDEALAHRLSTAARRVAERLDWVEILPSWETLLERAAATGERRT